MEKFVLVSSGKEVKVGDKIAVFSKVNTPFGMGYTTLTVTIDEVSIPMLLEKGVIKPVEEKACEVPMDLEFYLDKIAKKLGWKLEKTINYFNTIYSILPSAALSMVLREIAIEIDKKYDDHIENSPEIYVINMFDGRITKANNAHIKNYRNFAAFRSSDDARIACRIVKPILKEMFKDSGK